MTQLLFWTYREGLVIQRVKQEAKWVLSRMAWVKGDVVVVSPFEMEDQT